MSKSTDACGGFRILRCDPPRQQREGGDFLPIEEVAAEADILTLHTPLDNTTRHLADSRLLSLMRPDATFMNAARGEVADTAALVEAPQRMVIDVWENEPRIDRRLLDKAFIATPHIAGYSAQGKANATAAVVRAAARHFALPLEGWYPPQATPVERRPITWEQMCQSIGRYFDIAQQTRSLKASPETFESMRNNYHLRQEYFLGCRSLPATAADPIIAAALPTDRAHGIVPTMTASDRKIRSMAFLYYICKKYGTRQKPPTAIRGAKRYD